jgi:hypothetical protein
MGIKPNQRDVMKLMKHYGGYNTWSCIYFKPPVKRLLNTIKSLETQKLAEQYEDTQGNQGWRLTELGQATVEKFEKARSV